jgi:type IV pilus assembly protein PilE
MSNSKKGFTLIELLVVIALIGILSTIGIVTFTGFTESAAQKSAESSLNSMTLAQQEYRSNNGKYYETSGTSGTCTPSLATSTLLNQQLFGETQTDNLTKSRYYFCSTATTSSYTITAKHTSKTCQVTLTEKNVYTRTGCDG